MSLAPGPLGHGDPFGPLYMGADPKVGPDRRWIEIRCDFCESDDSAILYRTRDFIIGSGDWFNLVRCRRCGHAYYNPRPSPTELARYYPESYWTASGHGRRGTSLEDIEIGGVPWRVIMERRAAFLLRRIARGRLLEIGCGDGLFLLHMREKGWEVEGVEPGRTAARYARATFGLTVHERRAEALGFEERFDVVTLHQSLQCMDRPSRVLHEAWKALKPGGYVHITVPNFAGFDRRLFRSGWVGLQAPSNLHHFTPSMLRMYFDRIGFQQTDLRFLSNETRWPAYYSDSLRRCLALRGLYTPTVMAPQREDTPQPTRSAAATDRMTLRLLHRVEHRFFSSWGALMDRLGWGSSFVVLARKVEASTDSSAH